MSSPRNERSPRRGSYYFNINILDLEEIEIEKVKDVTNAEEMDMLQNIAPKKETVVMIEVVIDLILDLIEDLKEVELLVKIATIVIVLDTLLKIALTLQKKDMKEIVMIGLNQIEGVVKEVDIWDHDLQDHLAVTIVMKKVI